MPTLKLPPRPDKPPRKKKYPAPQGYMGGWAKKPKLAPKKFKTIKTGKGYYIAKPLGPKGTVTGRTPGPKTPKPPAPPPGPYDAYATSAPWGKAMLEDLDRREAAHTGYVTGQVMPWLSAGLRGLTGVDPAAPGYNPVIQQQYQANIQGQVGGALNAAAAAVPGAVAPTTPGASTAAPNAYLGAAMREASAQRGGAAILNAQAQSYLNTAQPNIYAQSAMRSIADYAAGLPAVYVTKRNELRTKIEQFIEDTRHAKVMESINAMTAQGNLAISMGNLGIRGAETAADIATDKAKLDADAAAANAAGVKPAPAEGYVVVKEGGVWKYKRDPTVPQATAPGTDGSTTDGGTSTRDAQGRLLVPSLEEGGYRRSGVKGSAPKPKVPAGWKVTKGSDGAWWILKPGAKKGAKPKSPEDLTEELQNWYREKVDVNYAGPEAGRIVANWVYARKGQFTQKANGLVNYDKIRNLLVNVIGGSKGTGVPWLAMASLDRYIRNNRWV